jgi:HAD superfamily hydrolase (TIGR01662 family)
MTSPITTIVVPTIGRRSLTTLAAALADQTTKVDCPVLVMDDRRGPDGTPVQVDGRLDVRVVRTGGGGPARARNLGWRLARTPWVSFVDDDVLVPPDWYARLLADLADAGSAVGSQGRLHVPMPEDRRPTDWERGTAGLETARWITADMSYRREALSAAGGFDERFPRAFREDADLALRVGGAEGRIVTGTREVKHPVRPADDWVSVRQQAGNQDDALMRALHGRDWHRKAGATVGRRPRHLATTLAATAGVLGVLSGRRRLALTGFAGWFLGTGELAWARIAPGPRDAPEVRRMVLTSALIPPLATWHTLRGRLRHRRATPWRGLPDLVLVDRDGTLVHDVPYNGDPSRVQPMAGARSALDRLRAHGIRLAVVSNQSGVARGLIAAGDVEAVNLRVEGLLGPFDGWYVCPHDETDGCECRKPAPGLLKWACADLGVDPSRAVMVGDIGADVAAGEAAGVSAVLVPTVATRPEEVAAAPRVADDLADAVTGILRGDW